jgi:hypothetical protein
MKPRTKKLAPFVPLTKDTMKTPAWKATSHGARSLYAALKGRYNNKLQNSVYLAGRDASKELGSFSRRDNVRRWFRELDYYGFIRMVSLAHHGVNGHGRAPHYRLTEEWYNGQVPTRDYLNWDGVIFHEQKTPGHYQIKNRSRGPYAGATLAHPLCPLTDAVQPKAGNGGPPAGAMCQEVLGPPAEAITSLTTPLPETVVAAVPAVQSEPAPGWIAWLPAEQASLALLAWHYADLDPASEIFGRNLSEQFECSN